MDENAEIDFVLNGINEDPSENFFILDGIQTFQPSEMPEFPFPGVECAPVSKNFTKENSVFPSSTEVFCSSGLVMEPSQTLSQDCTVTNASRSSSIPKENSFGISLSSREVFMPSGPNTVQLAMPVHEDRRPTTTSSLNVYPIGNLALASNKDVFCSTGLVMFSNSTEDSQSRRNLESNLILKKDSPQKPGTSINTITINKPISSTKPIIFVCPSQNSTKDVPGNRCPSTQAGPATVATSEKVNLDDKYQNIRAVSDFVGNAAKAVQSTFQPQIVQTSNVNEQVDSVRSLRDVRKSNPWSKSTLSDLIGFRNANSLTNSDQVVVSSIAETVLPPSPVLQDGRFAVPSTPVSFSIRNLSEDDANGMTSSTGMASTTTVQESPSVITSKSSSITTHHSTEKNMVQVFCSRGFNMEQPPPSKEDQAQDRLKSSIKENGISLPMPTPKDVGKTNHVGRSTRADSKKKSDSDSESEISVVQEKESQKKAKIVVAHTVEDDSDSDVCIVEEQIRKPFRMRGRYNMMKPQFKCSECTFRTTSIKLLQVHEEVHPKGRKIKCSKCSFETRIKSCMIYHAAIHSGEKKFRCAKCNFKTDILENFLHHETQKFSCFKCDAKFHQTKDLVLHMNESHYWKDKIYVCGSCSFTASERAEVDAHRKDSSSRAKFDCQWSSTDSGSKTTTVVQSRRRPKNNELHCKKCNVTCKNRFIFNKHLLKHKPAEKEHSKSRASNKTAPNDPTAESKSRKFDKRTSKYNCLLCDAGVSTKNALKLHHLRKHGLAAQSTPNEFQCAECHYVTDEKLFFERHAKIHSKVPDLNSSIETQLFKCSFCDFETEFEEMIRSHLSTHSESDSDFDGDFETPVTFGDIKAVENVGGSLPSPAGPRIKAKQNWKFQCANCDFGTNLDKHFYKHRSLHLRQKVFSIIFDSTV